MIVRRGLGFLSRKFLRSMRIFFVRFMHPHGAIQTSLYIIFIQVNKLKIKCEGHDYHMTNTWRLAVKGKVEGSLELRVKIT